MMKKEENNSANGRRDFMKTLAMGSAAGFIGMNGLKATAAPYETPGYAKAMAPIRIKSVKAITTCPFLG